jgi:hypothetical protein
MGRYGIKKGQLHWSRPFLREERYEACLWQAGKFLGCFLFEIVCEFFKGLTFLSEFTFSTAYFDVNLWTAFPLFAYKIAHRVPLVSLWIN